MALRFEGSGGQRFSAHIPQVFFLSLPSMHIEAISEILANGSTTLTEQKSFFLRLV